MIENQLLKTTPKELIGYLIKKPTIWPEYARKCLLTNSTSFDMELPWTSFASIHFLKNYLKKSMTVFEYGGGGSTLFFAKRVAKVISIENDMEWVNKIKDTLKKHNLTNTEVHYKEFDRENAAGFASYPYMQSIKSYGSFDVILVDGLEIAGFQARPQCFALAEKHIKPGGIIIVDDAWRYPHLKNRSHAKKHMEFKGHGPARKGLTQTDVYFY